MRKNIIKKLFKKWQLSPQWKVNIDVCGMLHIYDPSGASAAWMGDGKLFAKLLG